MQVFNILGQYVTTLVDEQKTAGEYSVVWQATGQPTGIYMLRFEINGKVKSVKKVILSR